MKNKKNKFLPGQFCWFKFPGENAAKICRVIDVDGHSVLISWRGEENLWVADDQIWHIEMRE